MKKEVPISKPYIGYAEYKYVIKSLINNVIGGASENNKACEKKIIDIVQHKYCKVTSSGTTALQIAFEAAKFFLRKKKLTIIVPNVTFGATVNAAILTSNNVILADVDPKTGLLSRDSVKKIITKTNVDCICLVSLNGRLVNVNDLQYYTKRGLLLIEDQAEALVSQYEKDIRSRYIFMSTLSFYANKIVTSGEGGAICFSNESILKWVTNYINHGMSSPGTYRHDIVGSNYRMSSFNASLLRGQLDRIEKVIRHRKNTWAVYFSKINDEQNQLRYIEGEIPWLLEYKTQENCKTFESRLLANGIQYRKYFSPMDHQPAFKTISSTSLENSYTFINNRYFLPLYYGMSNYQLSRIIDTVKP